jgi:catechol 2,3-dioxygenase-like lactoylglutathione lyase family enzyme
MSTSEGKVDFKLEVQIIPVSDVDRSKRFYQGLGLRLDADPAGGPSHRPVHAPGLRGLSHLRQGAHHRRARLGRGGPGRLRNQSGP